MILDEREIEKKIEDLEKMKRLIKLLTTLYHHHKSQSKSFVPVCSKGYHETLYSEIESFLWGK